MLGLLVLAALSFCLFYCLHCFQLLPALLSVLIFHIFLFFRIRPSLYLCFCLACAHTFSLSPHTNKTLSTPLSLSLSPCCFSLCSFYLTHTVIVKQPRVQMLHSVPPPFSMWSCEKSHEPSRVLPDPASTQQ